MQTPKFQNEALTYQTNFYIMIFQTNFIFWSTTFFFMNEKFLKYLKPLWKTCFFWQKSIFLQTVICQTKSQRSCYLKELRNCIPRIICVHHYFVLYGFMQVCIFDQFFCAFCLVCIKFNVIFTNLITFA